MRSNSSSASRSSIGASERRAYRPRSKPSRVLRSSTKGPALTTTTYVESRGVSAYVQVPTPSSVVTSASPVLLVTSHRSGTWTVMPNTALRSGWSKQANTTRASSGSKEVQT